jgi:hypothetical protein
MNPFGYPERELSQICRLQDLLANPANTIPFHRMNITLWGMEREFIIGSSSMTLFGVRS